MAVGTNFHIDFISRGPGWVGSPTGTGNGNLFVFRMDAWFQLNHLLKLFLSIIGYIPVYEYIQFSLNGK